MTRALLAMRLLPLLSILSVLSVLVPPARAQEFTPPPMNDPLVRRLLCTGNQKWTDDGPGYSRATIFSVPEADGRSERLYVGFVGDTWYSRTGHALWRGPVATRWQRLREWPGYVPRHDARNQARYRVDRLTTLPGGRMVSATMEIVLDARPPQLRLVRNGPGQPQYLDTQPLGEEVPMNEALKLVIRLRQEAKASTEVLEFRAYAVDIGVENPEQDRMKIPEFLDGPQFPYLLAVCGKHDPSQSAFHFLPLRYFGWEFEKMLSLPAKDDANGTFSALLVANYWGKDASGFEQGLGRRVRVDVNLRDVSTKTVQSQLVFDPETGSWDPSRDVIKRYSKQ